MTPEISRADFLETLEACRFEEAMGLDYRWNRAEFNRAFLKVSARWAADSDVRIELNKARNVLLAEDDRARGIRLFGLREFDVARECLERAAAGSEANLDYHWLGRTLLELGQTKAAVEQFTKAVKVSESANDLLWLGSALVTLGLRTDALVQFARAVEIRGEAADHLWYGKTLTELGHPRKAVRSLRLAVSGRGSPEDISWLGRALAAAGAKRKAVVELSKVASLRGWADDWYWLGRTLAEIKRGVEAIPPLRKAVSTRGTADDLHWLGRALFEAGLKEEAITYLEQAVQERGNGDDQHWLGSALLNAERFSEALGHLEEAVELRDGGVDHYLAGVALENLGRRADAASHFREAVERRGSAADCFELGKCLYGLKNRDEALLMFQRALQLRRDPLYAHWAGRVLLEGGASQEALPFLAEAFRGRNGTIDLLLLKQCMANTLAEAAHLLSTDRLLSAERLFKRVAVLGTGLPELSEQTSEAQAGCQRARRQLGKFTTVDDSLRLFEKRDLNSTIAAPLTAGTEVQTGELSTVDGYEWLEATLQDGSIGFILLSTDRIVDDAAPVTPEQDAATDAEQVSAENYSARLVATQELHEQPVPPYARFTAQLIGSCVLLSVFAFELADGAIRHQWNARFTSLVFICGCVVAAIAQRTWRRVVTIERDDVSRRRHRRLLLAGSVISVGMLAGAVLVGIVIGQNRTEAAQLSADLKRMAEVGDRVSKARTAVGSTIESYVKMYEAIEPDVQDLEATLQRLKSELGIYDSKFPSQHEATAKSIVGIETGIHRATLLKQQIEVAKKISDLPPLEMSQVWREQMLPLLTQEDNLDKAK